MTQTLADLSNNIGILNLFQCVYFMFVLVDLIPSLKMANVKMENILDKMKNILGSFNTSSITTFFTDDEINIDTRELENINFPYELDQLHFNVNLNRLDRVAKLSLLFTMIHYILLSFFTLHSSSRNKTNPHIAFLNSFKNNETHLDEMIDDIRQENEDKKFNVLKSNIPDPVVNNVPEYLSYLDDNVHSFVNEVLGQTDNPKNLCTLHNLINVKINELNNNNLLENKDKIQKLQKISALMDEEKSTLQSTYLYHNTTVRQTFCNDESMKKIKEMNKLRSLLQRSPYIHNVLFDKLTPSTVLNIDEIPFLDQPGVEENDVDQMRLYAQFEQNISVVKKNYYIFNVLAIVLFLISVSIRRVLYTKFTNALQQIYSFPQENKLTKLQKFNSIFKKPLSYGSEQRISSTIPIYQHQTDFQRKYSGKILRNITTFEEDFEYKFLQNKQVFIAKNAKDSLNIDRRNIRTTLVAKTGDFSFDYGVYFIPSFEGDGISMDVVPVRIVENNTYKFTKEEQNNIYKIHIIERTENIPDKTICTVAYDVGLNSHIIDYDTVTDLDLPFQEVYADTEDNEIAEIYRIPTNKYSFETDMVQLNSPIDISRFSFSVEDQGNIEKYYIPNKTEATMVWKNVIVDTENSQLNASYTLSHHLVFDEKEINNLFDTFTFSLTDTVFGKETQVTLKYNQNYTIDQITQQNFDLLPDSSFWSKPQTILVNTLNVLDWLPIRGYIYHSVTQSSDINDEKKVFFPISSKFNTLNLNHILINENTDTNTTIELGTTYEGKILNTRFSTVGMNSQLGFEMSSQLGDEFVRPNVHFTLSIPDYYTVDEYTTPTSSGDPFLHPFLSLFMVSTNEVYRSRSDVFKKGQLDIRQPYLCTLVPNLREPSQLQLMIITFGDHVIDLSEYTLVNSFTEKSDIIDKNFNLQIMEIFEKKRYIKKDYVEYSKHLLSMSTIEFIFTLGVLIGLFSDNLMTSKFILPIADIVVLQEGLYLVDKGEGVEYQVQKDIILIFITLGTLIINSGLGFGSGHQKNGLHGDGMNKMTQNVEKMSITLIYFIILINVVHFGLKLNSKHKKEMTTIDNNVIFSKILLLCIPSGIYLAKHIWKSLTNLALPFYGELIFLKVRVSTGEFRIFNDKNYSGIFNIIFITSIIVIKFLSIIKDLRILFDNPNSNDTKYSSYLKKYNKTGDYSETLAYHTFLKHISIGVTTETVYNTIIRKMYGFINVR